MNEILQQEYLETELFKNIQTSQPVFWENDLKIPFAEATEKVPYSKKDVDDAEARLKRFAPFIIKAFPETAINDGLIESEFTEINTMKEYLEDTYHTTIEGKLLLKRDDTLPIAGTIKARGAIYEVLKHAETLALENGLLESIEDNYEKFLNDEFNEFFAQHKIMVGTTGNLGISVGVMGAKLGFNVTVHMSTEAKQWKKDLLRSRGVNVVEHKTNFTEAVNQGRAESLSDPTSYFVDDEHSIELFFGYTVAANRLAKQLEEANIKVDAEHPLFVYLPCGIGGSPGGISFGLKQIYGDHVHCIFAEPTQMPSMLLGLATKEFDGVTVDAFGIESRTIMDGLAVPRTSGLISRIMQYYFDAGYTLKEDESMRLLGKMIDLEAISLEPAALAGVVGAVRMLTTDSGQAFLANHQLQSKLGQATHIAWATGGSMVPEEDMQAFYLQGKAVDNN
ncbi:D-serine ammonia-lyase [Ruoffia tabacinasalis]|uniref:Probable D-serine dehydratase n=1 Tax=Ruoffia tabacinasalis TaxID=87458 RepID=A0A5R9DUU6_9LACT|nr:D-serine ammonia-lyase [Ruoffia tabacinasalis]TLQ41072.1 D-serine ammonia-lyase [Ruoffia tabacinasalis]